VVTGGLLPLMGLPLLIAAAAVALPARSREIIYVVPPPAPEPRTPADEPVPAKPASTPAPASAPPDLEWPPPAPLR
jgi:hypothetical protein